LSQNNIDNQRDRLDENYKENEEGILGRRITAAKQAWANVQHNRIAEEMWQDYQNYLQLQ